MTIQVDDAGWGSLIGGVLIGAYRIETKEYVVAEVPVSFFQGDAFSRRDYLDETARVVAGLLEQLNVDKKEPIHICTGYVLGHARTWLAQNGYTWQEAKITGPLQDLVERSLLESLHQVGLTDLDYSTLTTKQGLFFWRALRWLKGGDINATQPAPERETLAKTGWSTYSIWVSHPYEKAKFFTQQAKRRKRRARREVNQAETP